MVFCSSVFLSSTLRFQGYALIHFLRRKVLWLLPVLIPLWDWCPALDRRGLAWTCISCISACDPGQYFALVLKGGKE